MPGAGCPTTQDGYRHYYNVLVPLDGWMSAVRKLNYKHDDLLLWRAASTILQMTYRAIGMSIVGLYSVVLLFLVYVCFTVLWICYNECRSIMFFRWRAEPMEDSRRSLFRERAPWQDETEVTEEDVFPVEPARFPLSNPWSCRRSLTRRSAKPLSNNCRRLHRLFAIVAIVMFV